MAGIAEFRTDLEHLGGYVIGGDPATFYPELWDWFVDGLGVGSVIDIGCGEGHALRYFRQKHNCYVLGIDGVSQPDMDVLVWDYTKGAQIPTEFYDLCWTCEFVEHVEEKFVPNFVATFTCCDYVAMTHAFPGQPGWHHVNCREPEYWKGVMAGQGFTFRQDLTDQARELASMNEDPHNHFLRSGLVFER